MTENNGITHLSQFGPVNTAKLLAMIAHFGTCENVNVDADAAPTEWTGEQEMVNGKPYYSTFIAGALEHVTICAAAQAEFADVIDAAPGTEPATFTAEDFAADRSDQELAPADVLNLATVAGYRIALELNGKYYDVDKLISAINAHQVSRVATTHLQGFNIVEADHWGLTLGDAVGFYEVSAGEQWFVIGAYAYQAGHVMTVLLNNQSKLLVSNEQYVPDSDYTPPAWAQQNNTSGHELKITDDPGTGLTRLPDDGEDDPTEYTHDVIPSRHRSDAATKIGRRWSFDQYQQFYASGLLGSIWMLTTWAIMYLATPQGASILASIAFGVLSAFGSAIIAPAVGLFGAYIVSRRPVELNFLPEADRQKTLAFAGATMAWGFLTVVDLFIILH